MIGTLVHEIAHSVLHCKDGSTRELPKRDIKELEAEATAYMVCQNLGIDTSTESFNYIAEWLSKNQEGAIDKIEKSMSRVCDCSKTMCQTLEKALEKYYASEKEEVEAEIEL